MKRLSAVVVALVGVVLFGVVLAGGPAYADGTKSDSATVGIRTANQQAGDDRGIYDYEIFPGGVQRDWVAVSNYRFKPITVRLLAKDATSNDGSSFAVQESNQKAVDAGSWIKLRTTRVTIPPRTEKILPFEIAVPKAATPGDHAGAIVLSLLAKEPKPGGGQIVVDNRVKSQRAC